MAPWENYLRKIYYDPKHPASFACPQKLHKVLKNEGKYDIGLHNHTYHRTIGMAPADVRENNQEEFRLYTYFSRIQKRSKMDIKLKPFKLKK